MLLTLFLTLTWPPLLLGLCAVLLSLYYLFLQPPTHPRNIPHLPFWVTLLPLFHDVDQQVTFQKYIRAPLEKHGAIKIFFGGQWNVIIQRSTYLTEVFRNERVFQKMGNQKKIPHSVLADFLGDNIISSRGDDWLLYRRLIKPGLSSQFNPIPICENATNLCGIFLQAQGRAGGQGVTVQGILQRYSSANLLQGVLGVPELGAQMMAMEDAVPLYSIQMDLKKYLFHPIFMSFPVLDYWLGSLIPSRVKARQLVQEFSGELQTQVLQGQADSVARSLVQAKRDGLLTAKQFRDNLNVLYVAGQENPQLLLISSLYLLGKYPQVQARLRDEIRKLPIDDLHQGPWDTLPYLTATILECLRLFPPIGQLINRRVSSSVLLGDGHIHLPPGTYVGYNSYGTNRDPAAWGPTADEFLPERWGSSHEEIAHRYQRAKAQAEFISFHGGLRACLGERFALLEMHISLFILVQRLTWVLDPQWPDRMTPAGPLHPRGLRLVFSALEA
ncbi:hypothetical protein ASPZODRAFT_152015 [Penicilliopsis zonata CBS 506.65]|uniref:Uncharacterized protein n=1 Tax=Penicilliopsis zonata CBS 506.65 TaxID=1073090 RepID=A0A1L9SHF4_9EURO|nr:hypothetical protein ASPZODRAFT_152015 [Penicilliopsis zonata CBS 506.65]OJJ46526.1 hypothetical protein ASPZODRAFT_152015 [Penicilliopsis zonata CBS 506.65]